MASKKTEKSERPKTTASTASPRVLPKKQYKSFHLSKTIRRPSKQRLPRATVLLHEMWSLLAARKGFFIGVAAVYGVLQLVLVTGVISTGAADVRDLLREASSSAWDVVLSSLTLTTYVVTTTGQATTDQASVYQFVLLIIASLATIWSLRHVESVRHTKLGKNEKLRIRDPYYKGMAPLVPFVLVLFVIVLEFIPLMIGSWLYSVVLQGGIAVGVVEQILWAVFLSGFGVLTIYLVLSTIFALYIVTLPDMTPMKALRSARGLVLHRRWELIRKFIVFAVLAILALLVVMMPVAYLLPIVAPWIFYILTTIVLVLVHAYLYVIYRELLRRDE